MDTKLQSMRDRLTKNLARIGDGSQRARNLRIEYQDAIAVIDELMEMPQ